MGLRINTQVGALTALRNLNQISTEGIRTLERLSTGLQINRASDNPSGLVIFEALRSQLSAIGQAVENTQDASNLVQTAEGGLSQISDLLANARALAIESLNIGVNGGQTQEALQAALDQTIQAVNRIAQTTRFGDVTLLNGNLDFNITDASPQLKNIQVQGGTFEGGFPATVDVNILSAAERAQANGTISAVQSIASVIRISGAFGTQDVNIAAGATQATVEEAINSVKDFTGVEASGGVIRSVGYGSKEFVDIKEISGDLEGVATGRTTGRDVVAQVDGQNATGQGNVVNVATDRISAVISVEPEQTGNFSFEIEGGGVRFQLGTSPTGSDRITMGVGASDALRLGNTSGLGNLATLATGGANSLANNPRNAVSIIGSAVNEVTSLRGRLGSVESKIFEANRNALSIAFENISASASAIGDADMAAEFASSVRNRIMTEVVTGVLRQTNLNAGIALRLLR